MDKRDKVIGLKLAYLGITNILHYEIGRHSFDSVLSAIMTIFELPADYREGLILKNARGDTFDNTTFDNYVHYFPKSNNTIFIRIDYSKVKRTATYYQNESYTNKFTPVRRQNCFIFNYPSSSRKERQLDCYLGNFQPTKRRRLLIHSKKSNKVEKKLMRL